MEKRTDNDGRWETSDGVTWLLVEPSQAWLDARAADAANQPEPAPPPLDEVFAAVPVVSLEEANETLLALKAALEARGIV